MGKNCRIFIAGILISFIHIYSGLAQQDSLRVKQDSIHFIQPENIDLPKNATLDINAPAKSAFYSAVLPGLGQAYNKQYWKIPVIYLLLGGGIYLYLYNQENYLKYRKAYQNRLLGFPDEFPQYSTEILIMAQSYYRRNRDLSLMGTILIYALNIIDANVSAHLRLWNINDNLSWQINPPNLVQPVWGLSLKYQF